VHPAEAGSFAHAMPALLRGETPDGSDALLGVKWVAGFPSNVAAGLPAVHGTTILSDARTGEPRAFIDAGALTAHRTAALSGLAVQRWGPRPGDGATVALIGAGAQARSHLPVIAHLLPDANVVICDRDSARATALAHEIEAGARPAAPPEGAAATEEAATGSSAVGPGAPGLGQFRSIRTTRHPPEAIAGADLVLTLVSFGPLRQSIPEAGFTRGAIVVSVDYDMCVPASLAAGAGLFLVDHREQYLANRTETAFVGYPERVTTIGEAISAGMSRPDGRVLVTHLGVGLADVVFADAVLRTAEELGIGTILAR